jgi:hypothetical protein
MVDFPPLDGRISAFNGLQALADATARRFHRGVVLYTGQEAVPFGPRLHAIPVSALWRLQARAGTADQD